MTINIINLIYYPVGCNLEILTLVIDKPATSRYTAQLSEEHV